ncbi:MAG: class I SAM-dependent methyltransferase [Elusimicrobia bacterium]|nr:class I SAM-dependent methyltransferase [Candidatus Liberimonas magnetica]
MGIARGMAKLLIKEAIRKPFTGLHTIALGRQGIHFSLGYFNKMAKETGFKPVITDMKDQPLLKSDNLSDKVFFKYLGCEKYVTLDVSNYEGVDYIFDLNKPEISADLKNKFDLIIDSGTLEHVFHLPNVLNNLYKMLKVNGRIIHTVPSSNHIDHGFYMFSPTFFLDYYSANKYEINSIKIAKHNPCEYYMPWKIYDYKPEYIATKSSGGLDNGAYIIICIATKTANSTGDVVPQQGSCLTSWNTSRGIAKSEQPVYLKNIKNILKKNYIVYALLASIFMYLRLLKGIFTPRGIGIKLSDKY